MKIVFDLSEVLLPGLIGVEDKLETIICKPKDMIAKALGSHPYHEINNNLEQLLRGDVSYEKYREDFLVNLGLGFTPVLRITQKRLIMGQEVSDGETQKVLRRV
ncbi:MAG: hypothetical protein CMP91_05795 [Gammaproteobacteria bacterium]|nr:hypothetical protein [Gammaproteobacteria bacterium]